MSGLGTEVIYDEDGRVKGTRYLPGAAKGADTPIMTTYMNNMQSLINTLLTKNGDGQNDKIIEYLLKRDDSKNDPITMAKNIKELMTTFGSGSKTLDEVKLLLDTKLSMKREDREDMKLNHEWDMQKLEKTDQSDMMKQYLSTIMGLKDEILPYIAAFLKGGQANRIGLQKQQMPNPYGNQEAAYRAEMARRQAYAQEQQAAGGMNPQQYEYAPPPAQEAPPPTMQEQQQQFFQMTPEQLMEVRNMAIQRMNEINEQVIITIDQEFQRRNQVVQRIQQKERDNLEFNPTRTDERQQQEPQNKGMYVPMNNEDDNTAFSHGVTVAYDPAKDEPEQQKPFTVSEDFSG